MTGTFADRTMQLFLPVVAAVLIHALMIFVLSNLSEQPLQIRLSPLPAVKVRAMFEVPSTASPLNPGTQQTSPQAAQASQPRPQPSMPQVSESTLDAKEKILEEDASDVADQTKGADSKAKELLTKEFLLPGLEQLLAEEIATIAEQTEMQFVQTYTALLIEHVEQHWSRPPGTRKGMVVELQIQLVPTGEIVRVSLANSSGNPAFDRSAELAIRKASPLPVPTDPVLFERYFRNITFVFNPKDLEG